MKTKIKINSIFGKLIFECEKENNSIKETVLEAVSQNVSLAYANLEYANLEDANLEYANLEYANLIRANLRDANLEYANLEYANLRDANLEYANLEYAKTPIYCKWSVSIVNGNRIKIGCKEKTIEDWEIFFESKETFDTSRDTEAFKRIEASYRAHKAYAQHLAK